MFPGHDVNFDGVNTLNQFVTFGIASAAAAGSVGPIDWATLAQQWIQMRDHNVGPNAFYSNSNNNNVQMPEAPPPPNISGSITEQNQQHHQSQPHQQDVHTILEPAVFEEKGEADMDMDDEEEHSKNVAIGGIIPSGHIKLATNTQTAWMNQKLMPTAPQWSWNTRGPISTLPQDRIGIMAASELPPPPPSMTTQQQSPLIPSLLKINVTTPSNHHHHHHHKTLPVEPAVDGNAMDAAKRKILPAWLREGIEKMEREKMKLQMERDQEQPNVGANVDDNDDDDEPITNLISDIVNVNDQESINKTVKRNNAQTVAGDDDVHEGSCNDESSASATKAHNDNNDDDDDEETLQIEKSSRTYEEKVSDLMMIVRRTLTELLLDVTNTEISNIAQETLKAQQAKASSAQVINKSALSSITGKLGLAVYDDSSSDSGSDNEGDAVKSSKTEDNDIDSEEELKKIIRIKRRNFARIAEKLEEEIANDTLKDEERLKYEAKLEAYKKKEEEQYSNTSNNKNKKRVGMGQNYEKDCGETTSDSSLLYLNGKHKQRDRSVRRERTTRFSDNNEPKTVALAAAASYLSQLQQQNINKIIKKSSNSQSSDHDDVTAANSTSSSTGLNNMLFAAEAALKKATKAAANFSSSTSVNARKTHATLGKEQKNKKRGTSSTRTNSRNSSRSESSTSRSSSKSASYSSTTSGKGRKGRTSTQKEISREHRRRSSSVSSDNSKRRKRDRDDSRNRSHYKSSSGRNKSSSYERHSKRQSRSRSRSSRRDRHNRSCSSSRSSRSHSTRSSVSRRKY